MASVTHLHCAGSPLQHKVQFVWINQEDEAEVKLKHHSLFLPLCSTSHYPNLCLQETAMCSAWYEVLSVLHLMATLSLSQANLLLLPRTAVDGYQPKLSEGRCYGKAYIQTYIMIILLSHK